MNEMSFQRFFSILVLISSYYSAFSYASTIERGLFFYRNPQSLFPSGQANRNELSHSFLRKENDKTYLIEKDHRQMWISAQHILRDVDVSKILSKEGLPVMEDLGLAKNLSFCSLRNRPEWTADAIISVPALTSLSLIGISSEWALVEFKSGKESLQGYLDLNNLVLKADFASFVLTKKNQWRPVQYRDQGQLVLDQNERMLLMDARALITQPDLGVVIRKNDRLRLSLKNHIRIRRFEAGEWNISALKGHGEVFWHDEPPEAWQPLIEAESLTTEDLLKREITSVAFHPHNPRWGVASSQGIYITTDGEKWYPVKNFGHRDFPVAINSKGDIIVGSFLSKNFDRHFEPYLRWEQLARTIETQTKRNLPALQIKNVSFLENDELKLSLDTGSSPIEVKGHPSKTDSWQLVKIR